ncbi:glutaredoxin family protein [Marilutibacter alkalisoli]|uniref:Glutaredoxin family protein n=1 Tax=Marilutibacter alkalisoli TaxID=2591633 RepID=A0A514BPJ2_9GAMM|nr:glutaredoxin family protein [Lysobacter alkalisoli]QDH69307.1 glutaredoxin family protein [Lysobacter alkalisoli]
MTAQPPSLVLYQRDDCHLCDLALEVLAAARAPEFESVFIDDDDALEERYGVRVPVLRDLARGLELDWPFDADGVRRFLEE